MRVHGYNDEKEIVGIDLPLHEIAISEIDPFRLDLFDPDPVVLKLAGESVYFSRLRDIVFAYRGIDRQILVGAHDGFNRVCFAGDQIQNGQGEIHLANVRQTKHAFSEHLQRYLYSLDYIRSGRVFIDMGLIKCPGEVERPIPTDRVAIVGAPKPYSSLELRGSTITIGYKTLEDWMEPLAFNGETFTEKAVDVPLPTPINWVLEALAQWQPAISDTAAWRVLGGKSLAGVDVHVSLYVTGSHDHLREKLGQLGSLGYCYGDGSPRFRHPYALEAHGCKFAIGIRGEPAVSHPLLSHEKPCSLDFMCISSPNEVRGSRIAFFDAGKSQTRALRQVGSQYTGSVAQGNNASRFRRESCKMVAPPAFAHAKQAFEMRNHPTAAIVYGAVFDTTYDASRNYSDIRPRFFAA